MPSPPSSTQAPRLYSTSGTFGEITVIAASESIVVDATTRNYDTAGHLHREHALARLSLSAAARLRDLLSAAIDHAQSGLLDVRQTSLWSETTHARSGRGRLS